MFFHCIFGNDVPIVPGAVNVYVDYCGDHIPYRYNTSDDADRRLNRLRAFSDRGAYRINVKPKDVKPVGVINDAVNEGVQIGFQNALVERCDGRHERDRCPIPGGGCACACADYRALPWWKKVFQKPPQEPSAEDCMRATVWQELGQ